MYWLKIDTHFNAPITHVLFPPQGNKNAIQIILTIKCEVYHSLGLPPKVGLHRSITCNEVWWLRSIPIYDSKEDIGQFSNQHYMFETCLSKQNDIVHLEVNRPLYAYRTMKTGRTTSLTSLRTCNDFFTVYLGFSLSSQMYKIL